MPIDSDIKEELRRIYVSAPPEFNYIETLELKHSRFSITSAAIANDSQSWQFYLEDGRSQVFFASAFNIRLPKQDNSGNSDMTITISNVDKAYMEQLERAQQKPDENIELIYRVYLNRHQSFPQLDNPIRLKISDVSVNAEYINATATSYDVLGRQFPKDIYRLEDFPGLHR